MQPQPSSASSPPSPASNAPEVQPVTVRSPPEERAEMVHWLHPRMLLRTGLDALVAAVFGARADARLVEAMVRPQLPYFDYSEESPDEDFWLDYASDTGDGWNSTYAVARLLALPKLEVATAGGTPHATERGRILIIGGDVVYPGASRENYQQRFIAPYEAAMKRCPEPAPHLYAIPGNHDWYDGLSAFMRLFCANRWVAGRLTRQARSYFALKLPRGWWLLGTDVQLDSDIDVPQVEYFRQVASHMKPEDKVILCNAEPAWITQMKPRSGGYLENNLDYLQEKVLGRRISLFLAGDLHHYRRHSDDTGRHKITSGGGGAFLHPTHAPAAPVLRDGYTLRKAFPDEATSRRLARRNLLLIRDSPLFGLMPAMLYLLLALFMYAEIGTYGLSQFSKVLGALLTATASKPWALVLVTGTMAGFMALADPALGRYRTLLGALHGGAHVLTGFLIGWGSVYFVVSLMGICPVLVPGTNVCAVGWHHTVAKFIFSASLIFTGGFFIGPFVMGLYLWVCINFFGAHSNEAFISLTVQDWKNFLRLRIGRDGQLTVYPVGLERVPRQWKATGADLSAPAWDPDDAKATPPRLIEEPVHVGRIDGAPG